MLYKVVLTFESVDEIPSDRETLQVSVLILGAYSNERAGEIVAYQCARSEFPQLRSNKGLSLRANRETVFRNHVALEAITFQI